MVAEKLQIYQNYRLPKHLSISALGFPMAKRKTTEANNDEIPLPEAIIQHIQSFLDGKQAAQTSVLSKSWYNAWLTRPNLDFDERKFLKLGDDPGPRIADGFWNFAKKTIRRYQELNLKIESFKLRLKNTNSDSMSLAKELIVEVVKMGVDTINLKCVSWWNLVLPHEVLQTETLVRLSVIRWNINPLLGRKVSCWRLKSLSLQHLRIADDFDWDIFRCLEDLTIWYCSGNKTIQISSCSLKCINLTVTRKLRAKFDVPNIKKFKFSGPILPSFSLTTVSREWESDISLNYSRGHLMASWFLELRRFLRKLKLSKVSLSINLDVYICSYYVGELQGKPRPAVVENLTLSVPSALYGCSGFLDDLLWSCRPKFIIQDWFAGPCNGERDNHNNLVKFLFQRLTMQVGESCSSSKQIVYDDLMEVKVESFEESLAVWRPVRWQTLLSASKGRKGKQKIRFRMKWSA